MSFQTQEVRTGDLSQIQCPDHVPREGREPFEGRELFTAVRKPRLGWRPSFILAYSAGEGLVFLKPVCICAI